jgi:hypothetical protein
MRDFAMNSAWPAIRRKPDGRVLGLTLCLYGALSGFAVCAEETGASNQAQPSPLAAPNSSYQPGFLDAFGRFLIDSKDRLDTQLKDARDKFGDITARTNDAARDTAGAAKDAATSFVGLPNARIITGRERCATAQNGAPDCRTAAEVICRGRGFNSGKSLDTHSAQKCPARVWLSGRVPSESDCTTETFVIRAVCQ